VNSLPEKIWLKVTTYYSCYGFFLFLQDSILKHHRCDVFQKQIAIGINEVTRVLERMNPNNTSDQQQNPKQLQVVILVADCKPRMLTKHIPNLAASRNVPVLYVRDNKRASLRLGELVKLKTALAIGIKARGNDLNLLLKQILPRDS
jgi:ribosomal protein L7Ae-like RNA K-turn-binding protein